MAKQNEYWFKRRRYGYGWTPVTKQGYSVTIGYILVIVFSSLLLDFVSDEDIVIALAVWMGYLLVLIGSLIYIIHRHGPKAKWRWGKSDSDNPHEDF